jgi:hypothetical protein
MGNGADENLRGTLTLFNPQFNNLCKTFYSQVTDNEFANYSFELFIAGYGIRLQQLMQ